MDIPAFRWLLLSGLLLSSLLTGAQPISANGTADLYTAVPSTTNLQYLSVFTHYHSFREQPLLPWQETNDNVGKIGGWRFYARDAKQPDSGVSTDGAKPGAEEKHLPGPIERPDQQPGHGRKP
ncbi:MAG: hypothetical protein A2076_00720 [Geobacteraceae bacterium GWC2_53_11]|nr:MAG: hypothetical protein A2076_00720 [Geobacteraceae bacterium GWC2_53_11]